MSLLRSVVFGLAVLAAVGSANAASGPIFTPDGRLIPPAGYRDWIFLTSSLDMNYAPEQPNAAMPSLFDNVFVNPEAYLSFLKTGTWPAGTIFVKENRIATGKGSINRSGKFQTDIDSIEFHVKGGAKGAGEWMFFAADGAARGPIDTLPQTASCYACHQQHAAVDTVFVQFYPTLLPVAKAHGTLSAAYRQENRKE
jgi:hypothetical protein